MATTQHSKLTAAIICAEMLSPISYNITSLQGPLFCLPHKIKVIKGLTVSDSESHVILTTTLLLSSSVSFLKCS